MYQNSREVTWSKAKTDCESTREYLAVFETEEAARWIVNLLKDKNNSQNILAVIHVIKTKQSIKTIFC